MRNKVYISTYDTNLIPTRETEWASWYDVKIAEDVTIEPGEVVVVKCWIKTTAWYKVYARSSLPKLWLMIPNSVGIIDSDYRWELKLQLYNFTNNTVTLDKYTRIGQIVYDIQPTTIEAVVEVNTFLEWDKIFPTKRWEGWFGSTNK